MKTPSLYERQVWLLNVFLATLIKRQIPSSVRCSMRSCRSSNEVLWVLRRKCHFQCVCVCFSTVSLDKMVFYVSRSSFSSESDSIVFCMHSGNKYSIKIICSEQEYSDSISPVSKSECFDRPILHWVLLRICFLKVFKTSFYSYRMQKVTSIYCTVVKAGASCTGWL